MKVTEHGDVSGDMTLNDFMDDEKLQSSESSTDDETDITLEEAIKSRKPNKDILRRMLLEHSILPLCSNFSRHLF